MPQYSGGVRAAGADAGVGGNGTAGGNTTIDAGTPSTGGYQPIPIYMANLRLPPKDCTDGSRKYYARAFEPRNG